ncbi:MAG: AAA family ATPase [Conexivisphaera sp.]
MPLSYDYVKVQNFKSLEDVRLELKKFNVIVGPNGSGKTNMIEAFIFARMVTRPPSSPPYPFAPWWGYENLVYMHDTKRNVGFEVGGSAQNGVPFLYWFSLNGAGGSPTILEEELDVGEARGGVRLHRMGNELEILSGGASVARWRVTDPRYPVFSATSGIVDMVGPDGRSLALFPRQPLVAGASSVNVSAGEEVLDAFRDVYFGLLNDIYVLRFDPAIARNPSLPGVQLDIYGGGLASVLYSEYAGAGAPAMPEGYLSDFLEKYGLALQPFPTESQTISLRIVDGKTGLRMSPPEIPDGYLKAIALFYILDRRPALLLVDELENSLHLELLELVISAFRSSGTKVIATTHSPMVVDLTDPGELVLTTRSGAATVAGRITNARELRRRLREAGITLSESWLYGRLGG